MREIGIYVHIPFCKQKCYYCDFVSYTKCEEKIEKYIQIDKVLLLNILPIVNMLKIKIINHRYLI